MSNPVEEFFAELLELPVERRQERLDSADVTEEVRESTARLLRAFESKSALLNEDLLSDLAKLDPDFFVADSKHDCFLNPGDQVGCFRIEKRCGEGGMSIVYRALQSEPIKRKVALKLIRPSVLTPKAVLRFFREQQALALVSHPNIATLYEVGTTPTGHPFSAMEYVAGVPITEFCRRHSVSFQFKIELFLKACAGLSQAHQHGIIHRDIKPDNILVTIRSGVAIPKLIDFGIAKFTKADSSENKTMTRDGQVLGSPRYMSPEQIEGREVDTRSDIYSAALVLFELLSLSPYRKGDTAEMMLKCAGADVELLSERCSIQKEEMVRQTSISQYKSSLRSIRRSLDWVLKMALERDPENRYETLDDFLNDLRAAKLDQPIMARKPGVVRSLAQTAQSNRHVLGAALITAMLVACGLFYMNWQKSKQELAQIQLDSDREITAVKRDSAQRVSELKRDSEEQLQALQEKNQKDLEIAKQESELNEQRNAASNALIIRLFASGESHWDPENLDMGSIRMYEDQFQQISIHGGPRNHEEETVCGILAVFYAMTGDFEQADELMDEVAKVEQREELQRVRLRICESYAANAKRKLSQLSSPSDALERAQQQLVLGRCYIVLDMLEESEHLITEAIKVFDEQPDANCDSLVAKNSLAKVYQLAGKDKPLQLLLNETYREFKDNSELLETKRGHSAFAKTARMLATADVDSEGSFE